MATQMKLRQCFILYEEHLQVWVMIEIQEFKYKTECPPILVGDLTFTKEILLKNVKHIGWRYT